MVHSTFEKQTATIDNGTFFTGFRYKILTRGPINIFNHCTFKLEDEFFITHLEWHNVPLMTFLQKIDFVDRHRLKSELVKNCL